MSLANIPIDLILLIASGVGILIKSLGYIQEGEQGIRLRFGKAQRDKEGCINIRDAGLVLLIPFVDTLKKHHVRQQTFLLSDQKFILNGNFPFVISTAVIFKVVNIYRALFEIDDIHNCVCNQAMLVLQEELAKKSLESLTDENKEQVSADLLENLRKKTEDWGIEVISFGLVDCSPDPSVANLVSMLAGVDLKTAALKAAADSLGVKVTDLPSELAAALIGTPVVSSIGGGNSKINLTNIVKSEEQQSEGVSLPFGLRWQSLLGK